MNWDAADTARQFQFRIELDNAERGREPKQSQRWLNSSRYRRAGILDAIAVLLLMALMAALGVIVYAASAKADVDGAALAYAERYGGAVCSTLDSGYASFAGIIGIVQAIEHDGLSAYQAGEVVSLSVINLCPQYDGLLARFINAYGPSTTGQVA